MTTGESSCPRRISPNFLMPGLVGEARFNRRSGWLPEKFRMDWRMHGDPVTHTMQQQDRHH